ncbi:hypothetical protein LEP1GSC127_3449 [Leptospira kirschneri str. 200801925]|nr:hypothetical protein LEP1GSC127_3449 [Leptospira kirschneri str. 200801925]
MLRIWIITILVCFSFGILAETSSKKESDFILIKKNPSKTKEIGSDKKKNFYPPKKIRFYPFRKHIIEVSFKLKLHFKNRSIINLGRKKILGFAEE